MGLNDGSLRDSGGDPREANGGRRSDSVLKSVAQDFAIRASILLVAALAFSIFWPTRYLSILTVGILVILLGRAFVLYREKRRARTNVDRRDGLAG